MLGRCLSNLLSANTLRDVLSQGDGWGLKSSCLFNRERAVGHGRDSVLSSVEKERSGGGEVGEIYVFPGV